MKTVQISLNSIDKVKSFVNAITQFEFDFDLISGRYVIDAKSIMGIFSLDLSKPIDLAIHVFCYFRSRYPPYHQAVPLPLLSAHNIRRLQRLHRDSSFSPYAASVLTCGLPYW